MSIGFERLIYVAAGLIGLVVFCITLLSGWRAGAPWVVPVLLGFVVNLAVVSLQIRRRPGA